MSWGDHDLHRMLRELRAVRSFRDEMDKGYMTMNVSLTHDGVTINVALENAVTLKLLDTRERELIKAMQSRRSEIERLAGELKDLESICKTT